MQSPPEVVVTGLGVVSPIGIGRQAFWESLKTGRSGIRPLTLYPTDELPVRFGGQLEAFDPKQYVKPRKALKVMCREIATGFAAASLAVQDARLQRDAIDGDRFGVVFGSQMIYGDIPELEDLYRACTVEGKFDFGRFGRSFPSKMFPLWMLKYLPNMAACHIAIANDAHGPNNTIVLGGVSSLLALIEGAAVIQRGQADVMIVGGTGSRLELTGWMYRGFRGLSRCQGDPQAASRPFDANRDGAVQGEGAGAIVIESRQHAQRRGAAILASFIGSGRAAATGPGAEARSRAIVQTIRQCLVRSDVSVEQISHVNAHGLSCPEADPIEAAAIDRSLGKRPVTALKSYFGDLGPGGGAVELAGSLAAMAAGQIPGTRNYQVPDPGCPVDVVRGSGRERQPRAPYVLKLSQSGTGQAAAVLLRCHAGTSLADTSLADTSLAED